MYNTHTIARIGAPITTKSSATTSRESADTNSTVSGSSYIVSGGALGGRAYDAYTTHNAGSGGRTISADNGYGQAMSSATWQRTGLEETGQWHNDQTAWLPDGAGGWNPGLLPLTGSSGRTTVVQTGTTQGTNGKVSYTYRSSWYSDKAQNALVPAEQVLQQWIEDYDEEGNVTGGHNEPYTVYYTTTGSDTAIYTGSSPWASASVAVDTSVVSTVSTFTMKGTKSVNVGYGLYGTTTTHKDTNNTAAGTKVTIDQTGTGVVSSVAQDYTKTITIQGVTTGSVSKAWDAFTTGKDLYVLAYHSTDSNVKLPAILHATAEAEAVDLTPAASSYQLAGVYRSAVVVVTAQTGTDAGYEDWSKYAGTKTLTQDFVIPSVTGTPPTAATVNHFSNRGEEIPEPQDRNHLPHITIPILGSGATVAQTIHLDYITATASVSDYAQQTSANSVTWSERFPYSVPQTTRATVGGIAMGATYQVKEVVNQLDVPTTRYLAHTGKYIYNGDASVTLGETLTTTSVNPVPPEHGAIATMNPKGAMLLAWAGTHLEDIWTHRGVRFPGENSNEVHGAVSIDGDNRRVLESLYPLRNHDDLIWVQATNTRMTWTDSYRPGTGNATGASWTAPVTFATMKWVTHTGSGEPDPSAVPSMLIKEARMTYDSGATDGKPWKVDSGTGSSPATTTRTLAMPEGVVNELSTLTARRYIKVDVLTSPQHPGYRSVGAFNNALDYCEMTVWGPCSLTEFVHAAGSSSSNLSVLDWSQSKTYGFPRATFGQSTYTGTVHVSVVGRSSMVVTGRGALGDSSPEPQQLVTFDERYARIDWTALGKAGPAYVTSPHVVQYL